MHIRDGDLRAFADGELTGASSEQVQRHLDACPRCRERLGTLRREVAALEEQIASLAPNALEQPPVKVALAHLRAQVETHNRQMVGGIMYSKLGLNKNWRRALSGLAVVAVVTIALSFAPVRAAARELLSVFRLERIVILPISTYQIENLESLESKLGYDFFPGSRDTLVEPGEPQHPETLAEASELAGFAVRAPADYPEADEYVVRGMMVMRFVPDLELMQALFEAAELPPELVPPEIDGQPFDFTMPTSVVQVWGNEDDALVITQMPSPTAEFPDEVDEDALAVALLQLLGLSAEEAEALNASVDWTTTLVLPLPTDEVSYQEVAVDGTVGFLIQANEASGGDENFASVLWQTGGMVYAVAGPDSEPLLDIANSLQ